MFSPSSICGFEFFFSGAIQKLFLMQNSSPNFPPFSLSRLMSTCFGHGEGEGDRLCILIDLPDLSLMRGLTFLDNDGFAVQKYAYETFHKGFTAELLAELKYRQNDFGHFLKKVFFSWGTFFFAQSVSRILTFFYKSSQPSQVNQDEPSQPR